MSSRVLAALLALLALGTAVPATAGLVPHASSDAASQQSALGTDGAAQQTPAPTSPAVEHTRFVVQLHEDGDATWTVKTTFRLTSRAQRAAFRDLATEFRDGDGVGLGLADFRRFSDAAESATGRSMSIRDVKRTASASDGTLSLQFRWTDFAHRDGNRTAVGDAFNATEGTWFPGLTERQTLVIRLPTGHGFLSVPEGSEYEASGGRIRWEGPQEFERGDLRFEYQGGGIVPRIFRQITRAASDPGTLFGGVLVLGLVVGTYALSRREGRDPVPLLVERLPVVGGPGGAASNGSVDAAAATSASADVDAGEASAGSAGEAAGAEGEGETAAAGASDAGSEVDLELLSDEERVERLLEENGGRMKQANIVSETGWSNAKVSQLLSSMAEEGRIDKLRIGRENLISFPDEEITDVEE